MRRGSKGTIETEIHKAIYTPAKRTPAHAGSDTAGGVAFPPRVDRAERHGSRDERDATIKERLRALFSPRRNA